MTTESPGRVELQQSTGNALQLPILIAVVIAAVAVSEIVHGPSVTVLVICVVAAAFDALLVRYLLRNLKATLVVTPDEIRFTVNGTSSRRAAAPQVITRAPGSSLTFRTARNGPMGSQYTGYVLKLRDTATGSEVYAGAFGRNAVQRACESQGWTFG